MIGNTMSALKNYLSSLDEMKRMKTRRSQIKENVIKNHKEIMTELLAKTRCILGKHERIYPIDHKNLWNELYSITSGFIIMTGECQHGNFTSESGVAFFRFPDRPKLTGFIKRFNVEIVGTWSDNIGQAMEMAQDFFGHPEELKFDEKEDDDEGRVRVAVEEMEGDHEDN